MKMYGEWRYNSLVQMEVSDRLHAPAALPPGKHHAVTRGYEAGWAPELFWELWKGEKSLASAWNRTPSLLTILIPTRLSRKLY
jgi:hypothetical protein